MHFDQPKNPHELVPHLSFLFKTTSYDKILVRSEANEGKSIRQHQCELLIYYYLNKEFKIFKILLQYKSNLSSLGSLNSLGILSNGKLEIAF